MEVLRFGFGLLPRHAALGLSHHSTLLPREPEVPRWTGVAAQRLLLPSSLIAVLLPNNPQKEGCPQPPPSEERSDCGCRRLGCFLRLLPLGHSHVHSRARRVALTRFRTLPLAAGPGLSRCLYTECFWGAPSKKNYSNPFAHCSRASALLLAPGCVRSRAPAAL